MADRIKGRHWRQAVWSHATFEPWRRVVADVRRLWHEGALTLTTPPDAALGEPILIETHIQPDGDFLLRLDPAALEQPELLTEHQAQVRAVVEKWRASVTAAQWVERLAWGTAGAVGPVQAGVRYYLDGQWVHLWWLAALPVPWVLRAALRAAVRTYVRRALTS